MLAAEEGAGPQAPRRLESRALRAGARGEARRVSRPCSFRDRAFYPRDVPVFPELVVLLEKREMENQEVRGNVLRIALRGWSPAEREALGRRGEEPPTGYPLASSTEGH
jgi:hypothetical protein